jgi:hypothetical protein
MRTGYANSHGNGGTDLWRTAISTWRWKVKERSRSPQQVEKTLTQPSLLRL